MSDLVAKARAALDGVTPGEWSLKFDTSKDGFDGLSVSAKDGCVIGGCGCCGSPFGDNAHDARFIAAARSLVPDMADRIEALEKELASGSFYQEKDIDAMQDRITTLEAENARLREAERTAWNTRTPASDGRAEGLREAGEIAKRYSATCAHEIFARANIRARAAEGGPHE